MSYIFRSYSKPGNKGINRDYLFTNHRNIAIIADGISDCKAGMQAAYEAVNGVKFQIEFLAEKVNEGNISEAEIQDSIKQAIMFTNNVMLAISKDIKPYEGWGTTLDCCLIYNDTAYIGHVGDSRAYFLQKGSKSIDQLTEDQVMLPPNLDNLPDAQRRVASMFSSLTNYMGVEDIQVDTISQKMNVGDILLLTTDGLTKLVSEAFLSRKLIRYNFPKRMKKEITQRTKCSSQYAGQYSKLKNVPIEKARQVLTDDITFITIKRQS